jgi:hypothetical protein
LTTGFASHPFRSRIISVKKASKAFSPMIEIKKKNKVGLYWSIYPPFCWSFFLRIIFLRPKKVCRLKPAVGRFLRSFSKRLSDSFFTIKFYIQCKIISTRDINTNALSLITLDGITPRPIPLLARERGASCQKIKYVCSSVSSRQ